MPATAAAVLLLLCTPARDTPASPPTPTTAPAPPPVQRIVYDDIDLVGSVPVPEVQILVPRQPLPDLSTTELLEQIDDRLEALDDERD